MDSTSIELPGSEIETIRLDGDTLTVRFSRAYLIKTMTGSEERTRWWQAGELLLEGARVSEPIPPGPGICMGGDIEDNVFTYRDMIPVPLATRGRVGYVLHLRDTEPPLRAEGSHLRLVLFDTPRYIEHIRPSDR